MSVIKFESYKETGKIEYVEVAPAEDKPSNEDVSLSELDSMAQVMEMSTDELLGELTIRVTDDKNGMRDVETSYLVDELTQRLLAIEYVIFLTMAKHTKK
tara:strand:- start:192 stop:491 length:300 start_codon:yes stop_codon:yes gene_type:complete